MSEDKLEFVKLAVSKDDTRFNLTSVYRAAESFVACDGHRLHIANGLAKVEPHYLNGTDAQFPEYTQVIPREDAVPLFKVMFQVDPVLVKRLEAMRSLVATWDKDYPARFVVMHIPERPGQNAFMALTISVHNKVNDEMQEALVRIPVEYDKEAKSCYGGVSLNLKYVLDVLKFTSKINRWGFPIHFSAYGEVAPTLWEVGGVGKAIIMPIRTREEKNESSVE